MTEDGAFRLEVRAVRVLHVEPDDALARHVVAALGRAGTAFDVARATTREVGIRHLIDQPFDATLVNLDTPRGVHDSTDGDFIRDVAVHAPATAIVACTSRSVDEVGSGYLRAGASDIVDVADLSTRILERALRFAVDRKAYESSIRALTTTDDLTGVGNRRALEAWYRAAANKLARHGGHIVIGVVDLDRFKSVNDDHGHLVGDQVLRETATRLAGAFRPEDAAVRLGGDEFAIVVHTLARDPLAAVTSRVTGALTTPPMQVHGREIGASAGFTATDDPNRSLGDLLASADAAMYERKRRSRSSAPER